MTTGMMLRITSSGLSTPIDATPTLLVRNGKVGAADVSGAGGRQDRSRQERCGAPCSRTQPWLSHRRRPGWRTRARRRHRQSRRSCAQAHIRAHLRVRHNCKRGGGLRTWRGLPRTNLAAGGQVMAVGWDPTCTGTARAEGGGTCRRGEGVARAPYTRGTGFGALRHPRSLCRFFASRRLPRKMGPNACTGARDGCPDFDDDVLTLVPFTALMARIPVALPPRACVRPPGVSGRADACLRRACSGANVAARRPRPRPVAMAVAGYLLSSPARGVVRCVAHGRR
jgi:hypothetical protein